MVYLVDRENLALSTLKLLLSSHVIPELGLGNHSVFSEDSEGQHFGVGIFFAGVSPSEDNVLSDLRDVRDNVCTFIWRLESLGSWADFLVIFTIKNKTNWKIIIYLFNYYNKNITIILKCIPMMIYVIYY